MREIRQIRKEDIGEYMEIYLNAYPAFKALDQDCFDHYQAKTLTDMELDSDVDFVGLFEDDTLVGSMKIVHFDMNLYGKMKPVYGLMALGVHRLHKKKHVALDLIKEFERRTVEDEALVSLLLPFNIGFYKRMGYGLGTKMEEYNVETLSLPKYEKRQWPRDLTLKVLDLSDISTIIACYDAICSKNHGMLRKFGDEARLMSKDETTRRIGCFEGDRLVGYVSYDIVPENDTNYTLNTFVTKELIYEDGQVLRCLLGFIRDQSDLARRVILRTGEEDFAQILSNSADQSGRYIDFGYLQTNVSAIGTMYKIPDPVRFVEETSYLRFPSERLTAVFRYEDALSKEAVVVPVRFQDGAWRIATEGETLQSDIDVSLSQGDFAAVVLGSCTLSSLIRLGSARIKTRTAGAAERLSALLKSEQKPWSNNDY